MLDSKTIADLRTKYSGELARLEERQKSLDSQKNELMQKLGITSLDGFDIAKEVETTQKQLDVLEQELNACIEDYNKVTA